MHLLNPVARVTKIYPIAEVQNERIARSTEDPTVAGAPHSPWEISATFHAPWNLDGNTVVTLVAATPQELTQAILRMTGDVDNI